MKVKEVMLNIPCVAAPMTWQRQSRRCFEMRISVPCRWSQMENRNG